MMNTRRTKLSMVRDDSQSSKTSNKKCPVVLHGDHMMKTRLEQPQAGLKSLGLVFWDILASKDIRGNMGHPDSG